MESFVLVPWPVRRSSLSTNNSLKETAYFISIIISYSFEPRAARKNQSSHLGPCPQILRYGKPATSRAVAPYTNSYPLPVHFPPDWVSLASSYHTVLNYMPLVEDSISCMNWDKSSSTTSRLHCVVGNPSINPNPPFRKVSTSLTKSTERRNRSVCTFLIPPTVGKANFVDVMKERIGWWDDVASPCELRIFCILCRTWTSSSSGSLGNN